MAFNLGSTTPLAKEATYSTAWQTATFWSSSIIGTVAADKAGTLHIQQSADGITVDVDTTYAIEANDGKGFSEDRVAPFWRLSYVNGAAAQGTFRIAAETRGGH